ncbi:hypothetical protein [Geotalea toluenoxydans]|uniref:hypothetical protein n=1 Tax=Geotalea toluenoxydans TaxID=421624 RepID=UPI001FB4A051|nr:hypothetical protein [Geotalea toluenoxydans]
MMPPDPAWCAALLTPRAFASNHHDPVTQTWQLIVTQDEAIWRREMGESFSFGSGRWG